MKPLAKLLRSVIIPICLLVAGCVDLGESPLPEDDQNHGTPGPMEISVANATAIEGGGMAFLVTRTGNTDASVSVSYATSNGTAFDGEDFVGDSGLVTIDSGAASTMMTITTVEDAILEGEESFTITLANPSHDSATIINELAVGYLWDDDGVSYASQIKPLIVRDCAIAPCHGGGSMQGGIDFGSGEWLKVRLASHLVTSIVVPGNAAVSHMFDAVQTGYMPNGLTPWTAQEVKLLEDWINQDAQDN